MTTTKGAFIAFAVATLLGTVGCSDEETKESDQQAQEIKCQGGNECKGHSECKSVGGNECKGLNECAGQGWAYTKTEKECLDKGGKPIAG